MTLTTTRPRQARPLPHNLGDWQRLVYPDNPQPEGSLPLSDELAARYAAYNSALGPVVTDDVLAVRRAIAQAHFDNDHSSLAGQRCVIVDGPPMAGKTHAALSEAFRETRACWDQHASAGDGTPRPIPWIYTEVSAASREFGILAGMHRFCGLPQGSRDTASKLLHRLRTLAPELGLRGVIIDDSHGLAGGHNRKSAQLADTLKAVITGIPATTVVIGANLERSGVLEGPAGEQVRYRSNWCQLGDWPAPEGQTPGPWHRLAATMTKHLAFPRGREQCQLDRLTTLRAIAEGSDRRPGMAIEWIKAAANHAIARDRVLDADALAATHRSSKTRGRTDDEHLS